MAVASTKNLLMSKPSMAVKLAMIHLPGLSGSWLARKLARSDGEMTILNVSAPPVAATDSLLSVIKSQFAPGVPCVEASSDWELLLPLSESHAYDPPPLRTVAPAPEVASVNLPI